MGSALYIVAEQKNLEVELWVSGKALARADFELQVVARELGVTSLMEFFSADRESLSAFIDAAGSGTAEEQWYSAAEGLKTVRELTSHLRAHNLRLTATDQVLADLADFERVLSYLDERNVRWHLAVDF